MKKGTVWISGLFPLVCMNQYFACRCLFCVQYRPLCKKFYPWMPHQKLHYHLVVVLRYFLRIWPFYLHLFSGKEDCLLQMQVNIRMCWVDFKHQKGWRFITFARNLQFILAILDLVYFERDVKSLFFLDNFDLAMFVRWKALDQDE